MAEQSVDINNNMYIDKNNNLDKIFWFKFIISLIMGVTFGAGNFTGLLSFIM